MSGHEIQIDLRWEAGGALKRTRSALTLTKSAADEATLYPWKYADGVEAPPEIAIGSPVNGMVEIAGPNAIQIDQFAEEYLSAKGDHRAVVADPGALYFGAVLTDRSLTPSASPRLGKVTVEERRDRQ